MFEKRTSFSRVSIFSSNIFINSWFSNRKFSGIPYNDKIPLHFSFSSLNFTYFSFKLSIWPESLVANSAISTFSICISWSLLLISSICILQESKSDKAFVSLLINLFLKSFNSLSSVSSNKFLENSVSSSTNTSFSYFLKDSILLFNPPSLFECLLSNSLSFINFSDRLATLSVLDEIKLFKFSYCFSLSFFLLLYIVFKENFNDLSISASVVLLFKLSICVESPFTEPASSLHLLNILAASWILFSFVFNWSSALDFSDKALDSFSLSLFSKYASSASWYFWESSSFNMWLICSASSLFSNTILFSSVSSLNISVLNELCIRFSSCLDLSWLSKVSQTWPNDSSNLICSSK